MVSGIYQIQSIARPERKYIGSAVNITRRWDQHKYRWRRGEHHSRKLQRHIKKYGEDDLIFTLLQFTEPVALTQVEQHYLDELKPYFNGRPMAHSQLGFKMSLASRLKISAAKKGADYWTGRKHSDESKRKMRNSALGRKASPETRLKLSAARMGNTYAKGSRPRLGFVMPQEMKDRISAKVKAYFAEKKKANGDDNIR